VGAFSDKFSMTLAAKILMGPKMFDDEIMPQTPFIIVQNMMEIERRTSAWEDEVWSFFLLFS